MASEAYVKITEVLKDAPAAASADIPVLVAGAIKASRGDFEPSYFESRQAFLDKYTVEGVLSGQEDVSLINAYETLGSFPILITRAAAKDYSPLRVPILNNQAQEYFALVFNDYMCDGLHKVDYSLKKSPNYPGAIDLVVKYSKTVNMYKFTYKSINAAGEGYTLGETVNLVGENNVVLKARVYDILTQGYAYTVQVNEGGTGYEVGDRLRVGGSDVELIISSVGDDGEVLSCSLSKNIGKFDITGSECTNLTGAGTGATFTFTSTLQNNGIESIKLLTSTGEYGKVGEDNQFEIEGTGTGGTVILTCEKLPDEVFKTYEVTFALDENVYDERGTSLFYRNVWESEWPFSIELGTATPEQIMIPNPYVEQDPTQPDTLTYLDYLPKSQEVEVVGCTSTIEGEEDPIADDVADNGARWSAKFEVYEDRYITFFSDFGTPNIGTYLKPLAEQFMGMYLLSLPRNKESVAGAQTWDDVDLGNSRRYACTPFAQSTHLGFLAYIAPVTQYLNTLATNSNAGREFEAIAGQNTGVVNYSGLTKYYDKADREALLDLKINTITYREVDGFAMFNDDLTGLVQNNPFKEEFNRRLGIEIAQSIDSLMQQFLFRLNTPALRETVQSTIENYLDTASFRDKFDQYQVICNDSNNPAWLQAQNKLAVTVNISFFYTAKYIEVLNNIYSTGQSFEE